jgi:hypothetical protein
MVLDQNGERALTAILARAKVDHEFRQELLRDPKRVLQETFGVLIPAGFSIRFIEREPGVDALVVLPDFEGPHGSPAGREKSARDETA